MAVVASVKVTQTRSALDVKEIKADTRRSWLNKSVGRAYWRTRHRSGMINR